jgi:hypothetical protein
MSAAEEDFSCDHDEICDGICVYCGTMLEDDTLDQSGDIALDDGFQIRRTYKKAPFSYYDCLAKLELESEICSHVCDQIQKLKERTHVRENTHIKNLFVMIYIAYTVKSIDFNPLDIGKKLGLTFKDIRNAVKLSSVGIDSDGLVNPIRLFSPLTFIKPMAALNEDVVIPEEDFSKIERFIEFLLTHDKMIVNEHPSGIAVTILKMYYEMNHIPFVEFVKKSGRTIGYIKSRENDIIRTLNLLDQR